jgi:hypothetical protein
MTQVRGLEVRLDGAQLEQLCDATVRAFNLDALKQLLRFRLGKDLCKILDCTKSLRDLVFDLVVLSEEEGWFQTLVLAIVRARSSNPQVMAFVEVHAPWAQQAPRPGDLSRKVKAGLNTVIERKHDAGVQEVLVQFRTDLEAARDGVTMLNQYKKLHELLHGLQVKFLLELEGAAEEARAGAQTCPLDLYAYQLRQCSAKARAEIESLPTRALELAWAASLDRIAVLVEKARNGKPEPLDAAVILLRNVLTEAARINSRMTDIVADLHLEGFVEALTKIREHFAGTPAEADVTTALEGLAALRPRLSGLMQEHYEWQIIDKAIGVAGLITGATLADRFLEWSDTQTRLKNLIELAPGEPWAEMLKKLMWSLEAAEASGDSVKFDRAFDSFRIVARDRFIEVDDMLLRRSGHLATVAPVLDKLL